MAFITSQAVLAKAIQATSVSASAIGDPYAVDGFEPELAFDFTGETYRTDGSATTFSGAMTHSATSLGTMVDGYGPELVKNGTFDTDLRNWTDYSEAGGSIAWNASGIALTTGVDGTQEGRAYQIITTEVGKVYQVTATRSGAASRFDISSSGPASADLYISSTSTTDISTFIVATSTTTYLNLRNLTSYNDTAYIDNISVREVPAIKWRPHNLLTYSEDFSNAVWSKGIGYNSTISTDQTVSPSGLIDADALVSDSAGGSGSVITARPVSVTSGTSYTLSIYAKGNTLSWMQLYLLGYTSPGNGGAYFDLQNGEVGTVTSGYTAQIADIGNGWYRCSLSFTAGASVSGEMRVLLADSDNDSSVARDGVTSIYIWGAHLYRSDLGGMVDNPDRGDSYVPTAVRVLPSAPELVTNGTFDSDTTGWTGLSSATLSVSSGSLRVTNVGANYGKAEQSLSVTSGKVYIVTFDKIGGNSTEARFRIGTTSAGTNIINNVDVSTDASYSYTFKATASTIYLSFVNDGTDGNYNIWDNISVKESYIDPSVARYLPRRGHYVYNGQEWTNRGLLLESEARTNLLTYSEDFTNVAWAKTNTATLAIDATGPDGQTSAVTLVDSGATGTGTVYVLSSSVTVSTSTSYTMSAYLKADQLSWARLSVANFTTPANVSAYFDLSNGVVGTAGTGLSSTIEDAGNGWYRCAIEFTTDAADTTGQLGIGLANGDNNPTVDLDGTSSILIYGAQLEEGSTPSSYMPTNGATFTRAVETLTVAAADLPSTISPSGGKAALVAAGWTITDGGSV